MFFFHRSAPREDGCTLIELLIGVAILGLLMLLVAMTFSSTFGAIEAVNNEGRNGRQAMVMFGVMTEELMTSRMHQLLPFMGQNDAVAFVSVGRQPFSEESFFPSGSTRIVYGRDGDRLVRLELRNLYGIRPEPVERTDLASGVAVFNLRYYDGKAGTWVNEWNELAKKALPRAVMIELAFVDAGDEPRTLSNVVMIPAEGPADSEGAFKP